jgi:hypothetical protein
MWGQTLVAVAACSWLGAGFGHVPSRGSRPLRCTAAYQQILRTLPKEGQRAKSARMGLEYWYKRTEFWSQVVRKSVKTRDGKAAEVVLLDAPSLSFPGTHFSMAFLMVDNRVIDWASCWSYNRKATQELMLEDVDGDGSLDLAFRATTGFWGRDQRIHSRAGDERHWLYAYAITSKGLRSLFPETDRDLPVKLAFDPAGYPVTLRVEGLPKSLREYRLYECTISATNTSKIDLRIKPGEWFAMDRAGFWIFGQWDKRESLKPGETVSQTVRFYYSAGAQREVTLRWKFTPGGWDVGVP